jgi:RIO kinase 1
MAKRTEYGQQLLHTSWISYEIKALQTLYAAGADVPQPFASGDNAILMTYLGGEDTAAPTLNTVSLDASEARPLFQRMLHNVEIMLGHGLVHGDLRLNVLYGEGDNLIDFCGFLPQSNSNVFASSSEISSGLRLLSSRCAFDPWQLATTLVSNHYRRGLRLTFGC